MIKKYKLIDLPFNIDIEQPHRSFSKKSKDELKKYCDWYLNSIKERIAILEKTVSSSTEFKYWKADYTPESLNKLGLWYSKIVFARELSSEEINNIYESGPAWFKNVKISNFSLSYLSFFLAYDIGMYISQVFLKNNEKLKWKNILSGRKNTVYFGQPVLAGFKNGSYFNPTHMISVYAFGLLDNTYSHEGLKELYDIWVQLIE